MNKKGKQKITFLTIFSLVAMCIVSINTSLSYFLNISLVDQQAGYRIASYTLFLNANIWDVDSPVYYILAMHKGAGATVTTAADATPEPLWVAPSKTITPTIDGRKYSLTVYEFDQRTFNWFLFVRMNPNPKASSSGGSVPDVPSWDVMWNQTQDIPYESPYNYYKITGWKGGIGDKCTYERGKLVASGENDTELSFVN